jgi:hypothetical protein
MGVSAAAVLLLVLSQRGTRRLIVSIASAGLLGLLPYLFAWSSVLRFLNKYVHKEWTTSFSVLDILDLLTGNRPLTIVWAVALPIALVWFVVAKRRGAVLLLSACLVPIFALCVFRPAGTQYAYSRYLLPGLPFFLILFAWLIEQLTRLFWTTPEGRKVACLAIGILIVGVSFAAGPLGLGRPRGGSFANAELALHPTRLFDIPWEEAPTFYETLAREEGERRILELPTLRDRELLLYRNYSIRHKRPVVFSDMGRSQWLLPSDGYVGSLDRDELRHVGVRFVIVHLDVHREILMYWNWIRASWQLNRRVPPFEIPLTTKQPWNPNEVQKWIKLLKSQFADPIFKDELILVWDVGA